MQKNKNKKIDINSDTTISLALLIGVISGVLYVASMGKLPDANAGRIDKLEREQQFFRQKYIEHTRIMDEGITTIKTDVGELKGMVRVILERKAE